MHKKGIFQGIVLDPIESYIFTGCSFMIVHFEQKARFVSFHPKLLKSDSFETQGLGIHDFLYKHEKVVLSGVASGHAGHAIACPISSKNYVK